MSWSEPHRPDVDRRDHLTGALTRDGFLNELAARFADGNHFGAVAFVDIDGLRHINATHGRDAGDAVLRRVVNLLTTLAGPGVVARLGGDEFAVYVPHVAASELACRLGDTMSEASFGVAQLFRYEELGEALWIADAQLHRSRRRREGR